MTLDERTISYFAEIGIGQNFTDRAIEVLRQARILFEFSNNADVFVCDRFDKEKNRNFTSLWIFDDHFVYEMKNFLKKGNIDILSCRDVQWGECSWSNTDLHEFSDQSAVKLDLVFSYNSSAEMYATGKNCEYLLRIYKEKILVHLK